MLENVATTLNKTIGLNNITVLPNEIELEAYNFVVFSLWMRYLDEN